MPVVKRVLAILYFLGLIVAVELNKQIVAPSISCPQIIVAVIRQ
jgi:hypothetical protein